MEKHIFSLRLSREADIFELFALPRVSHMDLLIRAVQDRLVHVEDTEVRKLWESVEALPIADQLLTTHLEHRPGKPVRDVVLAVRWRTVQLLVPTKKRKSMNMHLSLLLLFLSRKLIHPQEKSRLPWLLLTTFSVETFQQAAQCVLWYRKRPVDRALPFCPQKWLPSGKASVRNSRTVRTILGSLLCGGLAALASHLFGTSHS
jgi:hypothetical protein